jgi:ubiquinone biosynthesis monooxygenase Coq7
METEKAHLAFFEDVLPPAERSRLLPVWKLAGFVTGALPTLFGRNAVYVTIEAVETFVDDHYKAQVIALSTRPQLVGLCAMLERFRRDEINHRQEAGARVCESVGIIARSWRYLVGAGSRVGVWLARRV